jgi:hypothetical protein
MVGRLHPHAMTHPITEPLPIRMFILMFQCIFDDRVPQCVDSHVPTSKDPLENSPCKLCKAFLAKRPAIFVHKEILSGPRPNAMIHQLCQLHTQLKLLFIIFFSRLIFIHDQ